MEGAGKGWLAAATGGSYSRMLAEFPRMPTPQRLGQNGQNVLIGYTGYLVDFQEDADGDQEPDTQQLNTLTAHFDALVARMQTPRGAAGLLEAFSASPT